MANDLMSTLRVYLSKFSEGDRNPAEVVAALNTWVRDSSETIKVKIEEEVERSVKKMGFVKQSEFDRLQGEVDELKKALNPDSLKKATKRVVTKVEKKVADVEKKVGKKVAEVEKKVEKKVSAKAKTLKSAKPAKKAAAKGKK